MLIKSLPTGQVDLSAIGLVAWLIILGQSCNDYLLSKKIKIIQWNFSGIYTCKIKMLLRHFPDIIANGKRCSSGG